MIWVLLILGALGHAIFWVALVNRIHAFGIARWLVDAVTYSCVVAFAGLPLLIGGAVWSAGFDLPPSQWTPAAAFAWGYLVCGTAVCLVAVAHNAYLFFHPERYGVQLANHTTSFDMREMVDGPLTAPGVPTLLARLPGNEALRMSMHEEELAIPRWPAGHEALRIVHLSDLHMSGRVTKPYFTTVVDQVNRWQPDLVAITGDIVERASCFDWLEDTVGRLRAEYGVYFVLGNHDRKAGAEPLRARLTGAGLIDLGGKWQPLTVRSTSIILAGNERPWFGGNPDLSDCPPRDASGLPLRILLAHTPDQFRWAQENDFDLVLTGHVHGGQVRLPLLGSILAPSFHGTRYSVGAFCRGNTVLHVSRGASSNAPLRWNCPPEVSLLSLRRPPKASRG